MTSEWITYNELAWVDGLLSDPDEYEDEAGHYVSLIKSHCPFTPLTMLHLGSGAGGIDRVFKKHFTITGVDLSQGMLSMARALHPDIEYIEGDMRDIRLGRMFDVVAIPDSIDYMATYNDLNRAIETAALHLKPNGILLVVGKTAETFQNNNFVHTGEKDGINVIFLLYLACKTVMNEKRIWLMNNHYVNWFWVMKTGLHGQALE
ncbi:MAG: class I SAM-dependent methyltransferase [Desulfatiglans sp.]|jgi:ubiquinone/menaquinone biosynthesis C-methylase UbiE|nr:class I SAM-dependent methyltransferase [Desulfatiglans sp.]